MTIFPKEIIARQVALELHDWTLVDLGVMPLETASAAVKARQPVG